LSLFCDTYTILLAGWFTSSYSKWRLVASFLPWRCKTIGGGFGNTEGKWMWIQVRPDISARDF